MPIRDSFQIIIIILTINSISSSFDKVIYYILKNYKFHVYMLLSTNIIFCYRFQKIMVFLAF